ncbi:MAG: hypothetical protein RBT36_11890 [Desulfobulbus sp.]|jgi:hypothetical protein|nr:hypothetical protein [Desulfobulbus sp.]
MSVALPGQQPGRSSYQAQQGLPEDKDLLIALGITSFLGGKNWSRRLEEMLEIPLSARGQTGIKNVVDVPQCDLGAGDPRGAGPLGLCACAAVRL